VRRAQNEADRAVGKTLRAAIKNTSDQPTAFKERMMNEVARRANQLAPKQYERAYSDADGTVKTLSRRTRPAIDPRMKQVLVTVIRDCERLRGLTSDVSETALASQLEALIHHAGARLFARQVGLESPPLTQAAIRPVKEKA
jgi:hypothetical protein